MIAIVDYGVGNLFSLSHSLSAVGAKIKITADIGDLNSADKIVLPGVGAFGDAAAKLKECGLFGEIKRLYAEGKPILGICLGMQMMFESSLEYGRHEGLAIFDGQVEPLSDRVGKLKVPHMGWNALHFTKKSKLFEGVEDGAYVYFVHSYFANSADGLVATASYGIDVPAAFQKNNAYALQFHPEKSASVGLKILQNFVNMRI